jgi:integrating conjugative element protein (TIGR03761 family)
MSSQPVIQTKKPSRSTPQAGSLRNQASLVIQTRQAQFLLEGRAGSRGILGLMRFSHIVGDVWRAAQQDDPYADWMLLRVEEAVEKGRAFIAEKNRALGKSLNSLGALRIELANSRQPAIVELGFGTPFGFMGAYLLSDFDELARSALSAQHCALLDRDRAALLIRAGGNAVRRVYQLPTVWKRTGLTREAVRQGTDAAVNAAQLMGKLPDEVLALKRRSKYAPAIVRAAEGQGGAVQPGTRQASGAKGKAEKANKPERQGKQDRQNKA